MGGCSCKQAFRFKRLVDIAYPTDPEGDLAKDGAGKLALYIAHNNDSVPRVCRQIRKKIDADLARGHMKRVAVSAQLLRTLVRSADHGVNYYVPFVVDLGELLMSRDEPEYRIAGADVVSALGYQLCVTTDFDPASRRLLSDKCSTVLRILAVMASEGIATQRIDALHCRYAALVSIGNVAAALGQLLADRAEGLMPPVLTALHDNLVEAEKLATAAMARGLVKRSTREEAATNRLQAITRDAQGQAVLPIDACVLPVDPHEKDVKLRAACIRALACVAPCATTTLGSMLDTIFTHVTSSEGWQMPTYSIVVCHVLAVALQEKHRAGYMVCQHLIGRLETDVRRADEIVALLRSLRRAMEVVPMSASRPVQLFPPLSRFVTSSRRNSNADVLVAAKDAVATLIARAFAQRNIPAVSRLFIALGKHVRSVLAPALSADQSLALEERSATPRKHVDPNDVLPRAISSNSLGPNTPTAVGASGAKAPLHPIPVPARQADKAITALLLLEELAPIAACLTGSDRKEVLFVPTVNAVLGSMRPDVDGAMIASACVAVRRYVLRSEQGIRELMGDEPSSRDDDAAAPDSAAAMPATLVKPFQGIPPITLTVSERDILVNFTRMTLVNTDAWRYPSRMLGAVDVAGALLSVGAVNIHWFVNLIFDAQSFASPMRDDLSTEHTGTRARPHLSTSGGSADASSFPERMGCVTSAGLLAVLAKELRISQLASYAKDLLKQNVIKGVMELRFKSHPHGPSHKHSHRRTVSLLAEQEDDDLAAEDPTNTSRSLVAANDHPTMFWTCNGLVGLEDPNIVYPLPMPPPDLCSTEAALASRATVALYIVKSRGTSARVAAEFGQRRSDARVLAMLNGGVYSPHETDSDNEMSPNGGPSPSDLRGFTSPTTDQQPTVALPSFLRSLAGTMTAAVPLAIEPNRSEAATNADDADDTGDDAVYSPKDQDVTAGPGFETNHATDNVPLETSALSDYDDDFARWAAAEKATSRRAKANGLSPAGTSLASPEMTSARGTDSVSPLPQGRTHVPPLKLQAVNAHRPG
jgi:hypothetical protein